MTDERLRAWLDFYQELGLTPFFRRRTLRATRVGAKEEEPVAEISKQIAPPPASSHPVAEALIRPTPTTTLSLFGEPSAPVEEETLEQVRADLGDCQRCKLAPHRRKIVFGEGSPNAQLVFIGEGPGAEEDAQGLPFVGRAGRLLNHWIESLGLARADVYICNIIKCRPPGNRTPERDEIETCSPFLLRQLAAIRPKLVCCLGGVALKMLLGRSVSITRVRGQFFDSHGSKLFATFHPAYILRNPNADRQAQEDLRTIRQFLSGRPA
ncbi:MAG: uracil-DNA glycosylase [Terriglobia bacterium]